MIPLIGGTVTAAARSAGHWISFGMTLAMMIGISIYVIYGIKRREGTHWQRYGPTYLTLLASCLIMLDVTRHVLNDAYHILSEYRPGCHEETYHCLSVLGVFVTIIATYSGFGILIAASLWNGNVCDKVDDFKAKWNELKNGGPQTM